MPENPLQALFHNIEQVSSFVQHHLSNFIGIHFQPSGPHSGSLLSISSSTKAPLAKTASSVQLGDTAVKGKSAAPVTKEELGRATWTFLHILAAQYPDNPTRQQKKDVKELVSSFLPLPLVINYRISSKKLENVVDLFESLMYRCYLEYTLAGNVEITLKKFLGQTVPLPCFDLNHLLLSNTVVLMDLQHSSMFQRHTLNELFYLLQFSHVAVPCQYSKFLFYITPFTMCFFTFLVEQILYRLDRMLNFLSGYVMCIMLLIEVQATFSMVMALANQYSPVNELMQGGANWTVNRMHVKLLVVHQFLGRYGRNLPKND
ncbi:FAD-linked sulfhydryl oxidase ERV1 isoform B [Glycine soja]|nr:FAD-linked sulfhydryl oxidase ERV1 isoform B [Glycine soja]